MASLWTPAKLGALLKLHAAVGPIPPVYGVDPFDNVLASGLYIESLDLIAPAGQQILTANPGSGAGQIGEGEFDVLQYAETYDVAVQSLTPNVALNATGASSVVGLITYSAGDWGTVTGYSLFGRAGSAATDRLNFGTGDTGLATRYERLRLGNVTLAATSDLPIGQARIATFIANASGVTLRINGTQVATSGAAPGLNMNAQLGVNGLADDGGATAWLFSRWHSVVLASGNLAAAGFTALQIAQLLEGYAAWEGLPVGTTFQSLLPEGHPYKYTAPMFAIGLPRSAGRGVRAVRRSR
jgi:hypothetical protein